MPPFKVGDKVTLIELPERVHTVLEIICHCCKPSGYGAEPHGWLIKITGATEGKWYLADRFRVTQTTFRWVQRWEAEEVPVHIK